MLIKIILQWQELFRLKREEAKKRIMKNQDLYIFNTSFRYPDKTPSHPGALFGIPLGSHPTCIAEIWKNFREVH